MATKAHCIYCFEVLAVHHERREPLSLEEITNLYNSKHKSQKPIQAQAVSEAANGVVPSAPNGTTNGHLATNGHSISSAGITSAPLFVTWNTLRSGEKHLRGCIGTFEKQPLEEGLKSYAITSAVYDTRFSPITRKELPWLECAVTLLMDFEPASGPMDWEIGIHGIRINFVYHGRRMGATYLPDVALEQGWTKEEALVSLMRKAGWTGRKDEWKKVELNVVRYKGSKASVTYKEYVELLRDQEEEEDEEEDEEDEESMEDEEEDDDEEDD